MGIDKKVKSSKPILLFLGSTFLLIGVTLILAWWSSVAILFKGSIGIVIALGGMLILYMVKE